MRPTPQNPAIAAQIQQAVVLHQRGDHDKAETLYKKVLAKAPRHFQALYLMGMLELHRHNPAGALEWMDQALKINPTHVDTQFDRATALEDLERYSEALRAYDLVLALKSDFLHALFRRGNVLREMQRHMEALDCYKRVLAVQPDHAQAWFKQGNTLSDLGRLEEALGCYEKAVAAQPDHPEAWFNLGNTLKAFDRLDESMAAYDKALEIEPDFAEAIANRALLLHGQNQYDEVLSSYERALALLPDDSDTQFNRAATLEDLQRYDEAIKAYAAIAENNPNYLSAQWNEGICQLRLGRFQEGWKRYERRWDTEQMKNSRRFFAQPLWLGQEPLPGKTILLYAEQGFGDTLQFARYAPLLAERGARVILQVQTALKTLMTQIKGVSAVFGTDEPLPSFDFQCPLLSLPLACATFSEADIPGSRYLSADRIKSESWNALLGEKRKPRIGLVWAGSNPRADNAVTKRLDAMRSMPLTTLSPLLNNEQVEFHSLQLDNNAVMQLRTLPASQRIADHAHALHDFSDTAALIDNLDLVISVDTAVAHLAGTLGKPVWLLNRYNSDWRWMVERKDSPWYPSMRIFRQDKPGDWSKVIEDVRTELQQQTQH